MRNVFFLHAPQPEFVYDWVIAYLATIVVATEVHLPQPHYNLHKLAVVVAADDGTDAQAIFGNCYFHSIALNAFDCCYKFLNC